MNKTTLIVAGCAAVLVFWYMKTTENQRQRKAILEAFQARGISG